MQINNYYLLSSSIFTIELFFEVVVVLAFSITLNYFPFLQRAENVSSEMYLMDWYLSMFTKALPLELAAQVLDPNESWTNSFSLEFNIIYFHFWNYCSLQ